MDGIILVAVCRKLLSMKNTFLTIVYIILAISLSVVSFLFLACKKHANPGDDHPTQNSCIASKPAAENARIFPADNPWNKDISAEPVDPFSSQIIANFSTAPVKTDFGSGLWNNAPIGIPYTVVCRNQQNIAIHFTDYGDESDPVP